MTGQAGQNVRVLQPALVWSSTEDHAWKAAVQRFPVTIVRECGVPAALTGRGNPGMDRP